MDDRTRFQGYKALNKYLRLIKRARSPREKIEPNIEALRKEGRSDMADRLQAVLDEILDVEAVFEELRVTPFVDPETGSMVLTEAV